MKTIVAYCWANGVIEFGPRCPENALPLVTGKASQVRAAVEVLAVHAYDGATLLVPKSIAWCDGDMDAAVEDVARFSKGLKERLADTEPCATSEFNEIYSVIVCKEKTCPAMFTSDGPISDGYVLPCGHDIGEVCLSAVALKEE
jgi:hypothetical protein